MITEQQRIERRKGLGGSDIAGILGISPWTRPIDVYLEKKHGQGKERGETEAMWWGTEEEALIAKRFTELTGMKMVNYNFTIHDGCLLANIDRLIIPEGRKTASHVREITTNVFAEIKTSGNEWEPAGIVDVLPNGFEILDGDAGVPQWYISQILHYFGRMPTTDTCYVPVKMAIPVRSKSGVMFSRTEFRVYRIRRDDELVKAQDEFARSWWAAFIVGDKVPAAESEEDAKRLWQTSRPKTSVAVTAPLLDAYKRLARAKETIEAATAEAEKAEGEIKIAMKDNEQLLGMDGSTVLATWKSASVKRTSRTDWERIARLKGATAEDIAAATVYETHPGNRTFSLKTGEDVKAYVKAVDTIQERRRREADAARRAQEDKEAADIFAA